MPPSEATSQYPFPSGVAAMPTTGIFRGVAGDSFADPASANLATSPEEKDTRYPLTVGAEVAFDVSCSVMSNATEDDDARPRSTVVARTTRSRAWRWGRAVVA